MAIQNARDPNNDPTTWKIATQLLAYEAAADTDSEAETAAPSRVLEVIRRRLCTVIGVQGFHVLLTRSLTLAGANVPGLSQVTVQPDGSLQGLSSLKAQENRSAGIALTAHLLGLLFTFIGEELTLRIILNAWPEVTMTRTISSGETE